MAFIKSVGEIGPGLSIVGVSPVRSKTVDSKPISHLPPSKTEGHTSPNEFKTSSAEVGLTVEYGLALGAASGLPVACSTFLKSGCEGERIATVSKPDVTLSGTIFFFGRIKVNGPGQNFWQSSLQTSLGYEISSAWSKFSKCTIRGLEKGRDLSA